MPNLRTAIAAGTTVLALGGLTALAVSAGGTDAAPSAAGKNAMTTAAPPAEVRTVVVTKVIHRTRRAKTPRRPAAPARAVGAPAPAPAAAAVAAPVRIATRSAPVARLPVATHHAGGDDGSDDGGHSDD